MWRRRRRHLAGAVDAADARGAADDGRLGGRRLQGAQRAGLRRLACFRRGRHCGGASLALGFRFRSLIFKPLSPYVAQGYGVCS